MDKEKVILVGLNLTGEKNSEDIDEKMAELRGLAEASGAEIVGEMIQNRPKAEAATYIGEGKAEELKGYVKASEASSVIFNTDLSGSQIRNLEEILEVKVIDRTTLILDIFALRAFSMEGKLQVKLAQLKYRLPRLTGFGKALSRTGGGIGTRGPGEQKLETDRRHIRREIDALEKKLEKIEKDRTVKRKSRTASRLPIVSLVGYTNAGKSTIMNQMIKLSDRDAEKTVYEADELFATLDTANRNIRIDGLQEFILTDTVGFVSNLPTALVEAFHGTLEEIVYSDFIILVVDSSSSKFEMELSTTETVLKELGAYNIPRLIVYNKADLSNNLLPNKTEPSISICAKNPEDILKLAKKMLSLISANYHSVKVSLDFSSMNLFPYFKERYSISDTEYDEKGINFSCVVDEVDYKKFKGYMKDVQTL